MTLSFDKLAEEFARRWRQLTHDELTRSARDEAVRLRTAGSDAVDSLVSAQNDLGAEWAESDKTPRARAEILGRYEAALAAVHRCHQAASLPALYPELPPSYVGVEAYRHLAALYPRLRSTGARTREMDEFAHWLGDRIARAADPHAALRDLYSRGADFRPPRPMRDTEVAAEVEMVRIGRREKGKWLKPDRDAAIEMVQERLGPGAGVKKAVERRGKARGRIPKHQRSGPVNDPIGESDARLAKWAEEHNKP